MAPKTTKRKEESAVPNLPTINPVLNAAQIKFDKWVRRVQELTRAKADAVRDKSALVLTLREGESKIKYLTAEAELVSQQAMRPPPPPPVDSLSPAPVSKPSRKSQTNIKMAEEAEVWKTPEAAELKKLQKLSDALMGVYVTKRGGPDKVPENEKSKKVSTYTGSYPPQRRRLQTVDSPSSLATASVADAVPGETPQVSPLTPSGPNAGSTSAIDLTHAATSSPSISAVAPPHGRKGGKGKVTNAKEAEVEKEESQPPQQMVSMSLAAGNAVVIEEAAPEPSPKGKGRGSKSSSPKGRKESKRDSVVAAPPMANFPPTSTETGAPIAEGDAANGTDVPLPSADGMDRPRLCTPSQWVRILQLRQERLDLEDENTTLRNEAYKVKDRLTQLKEMEAISRYSLGAAQKELEILTGSPVAAIPGVTAPLPSPATGQVTPRGGPPSTSPAAHNLEGSPKR